jgi:hypothetical protein
MWRSGRPVAAASASVAAVDGWACWDRRGSNGPLPEARARRRGSGPAQGGVVATEVPLGAGAAQFLEEDRTVEEAVGGVPQ